MKGFILRHKNYSILHKFYWLLITGLIFNFNLNSSLAQNILAQNETLNITIDKKLIANPLTVKGMSGGSVTAREITNTDNTATGYCDGFVNRQPNHILKLDSFFNFLKVEVASQADTTIIIQGPGGTWCNDDVDNANPMIEGQWQPGIYRVWIGSYRANSSNDYQIKITGSN